MNLFINKLNLLHVEVYQNEISRRLPTVLFYVIFSYCRFHRDKIENSSGMHFFMFEIFDQRR